MNLENVFLKLALAAVSTVSALNVYSAEAPRPIPGDIPRAGPQLWLSASQVEQIEGGGQAVEKYVIAQDQMNPGANPATAATATIPAALPGKGPAQHPFLYAGEWDTRKPLEQSIFIVREGKIVW
jgi:hypothetical protein